MSKLETSIYQAVKKKKIALMTHVVIGYPTLADTENIILAMVASGVDVIELQIPFSDPLADGPVIMAANDQALRNGITVNQCLAFMKKMSSQVSIPLLFMSYYQPLFHFGIEAFCEQAQAAGCQGLIVPDIPYDEEKHEGFVQACICHDLHHVRLLSPNILAERLEANASLANGFVYVTARQGITGATSRLDTNLGRFLKKVKAQIGVPLAVGFGISQPHQVEALVGQAEIAVVGTAIIEKMKVHGLESLQPFIKHLRSFSA